MRVFAGLWPTPEVSEHLRSALRAAAGADPVEEPGRSPVGVRWTAAENWHVTLAFYGEVGDGLVESLVAATAQVAATSRPFDLELAGAGVFAHRTLWAGVGGDVTAARALVDACRAAGDDLGVRQDGRERSRPHLTLGRVAPSRAGRRRRDREQAGPDPSDLLVHALSVYRGPCWPVTELVLAESRPGEGRAGGPLYLPLGRWPLAARP
ncbi:MAG TPA: RNA 2',3'-cyclic phosphodiesterase [Cellulomonas sp.]